MTGSVSGLQLALLRRLFKLTLPSRERWSPFGLRRIVTLSVLVPLFLLVQLAHWIGLLLDDLLFPEYKHTQVREPLFVVGLPRSGTSYIQQTLALDERFTTMKTWELVLAPSITERKVWFALGRLDRTIGRPIGRLVARLQRRLKGQTGAVHTLDLTGPEEDFLLLLPAFGCFLLVLAFPYHPEVWRLARLDDWSSEEREALLRFYRSCVQRHLYVVGRGKTFLSKNPSFTAAVRSLASEFPDARFLFCIRDPVDVVPSQLSSVRGAMRFFGVQVAEPRLRERFVSMLEDYGERMVAASGELAADRRMFVPLLQMRADLPGTIEAAYRRFDWVPSPSFRSKLAHRASEARTHVSRHSYERGELGLSRREIEERFAAFRERFGFREEARVSAGGEGEGGGETSI